MCCTQKYIYILYEAPALNHQVTLTGKSCRVVSAVFIFSLKEVFVFPLYGMSVCMNRKKRDKQTRKRREREKREETEKSENKYIYI